MKLSLRFHIEKLKTMKYLSLKEAIKILKKKKKYCSREYLSKLAREKKLKAIKIRNRWMTTEKWLKECFSGDFKTKSKVKEKIKKAKIKRVKVERRRKREEKKTEKETPTIIEKKGFVLPLYFGYGLKISLIKLSSRYLNLTSKLFKKRWKEAVVLSLLVSIITSSFFLFNPNTVKGATYYFVQTDWSGGADTVNFPNHTSNQTGWTKYYEKDGNITAGATLTLSATSDSWTQTTANDFDQGIKTDVTVGGGTVKVYDFSDTVNNKAYEKNGFPSSPADYDSEAVSGDYTDINSSNDTRWVTALAADGGYDSQIFTFNITEEIASVSNFSIDWEGYGETGEGLKTKLYAYNWTTAAWDLKTDYDFTSATDNRLVGTISSNLGDYIHSTTKQIAALVLTEKPKALGSSCSSGSECASGFCVDSVCCDSACSEEICQTCGALSSNGIGHCGYVNSSSEDPRDQCGPLSCSDSGNCSGSGYSCGVPADTTWGSGLGTCSDSNQRCYGGECITCGGWMNAGYCWYEGDYNQSCTAVCTTRGGVYQGTCDWVNDPSDCSTCKHWHPSATCDGTLYFGPVFESVSHCYYHRDSQSNCDYAYTYYQRQCACNKCPFIYSWNGSEYVFDNYIIHELDSRDKETIQERTLNNLSLNGKIKAKITEEMNETAFIDQIYLKISKENKTIKLKPISATKDLYLIQESDDNYLIMNYGDEIEIEFENVPEFFKDAEEVKVVAEGYYIKQAQSSKLKVQNHNLKLKTIQDKKPHNSLYTDYIKVEVRYYGSGSESDGDLTLLPPITSTGDDFTTTDKISSSNNIVVESSQVKLSTISDSLILRPNGAGSETSISYQYPSSGSHYDKVDEETADDDTTYVWTDTNTLERDLYALQDTSQTGDIEKIKVYWRVECYGAEQADLCDEAQASKPSIRTHNTIYDGSQTSHGYAVDTYYTYSQEWTTNPYTGNAWTWDEINSLETGVNLYSSGLEAGEARCTQVYVEVYYSTYPTSGSFQSTNLLEGQSVGPISSFTYNLSSLPANTGAKVCFSQDSTNWYNSSGNSVSADDSTNWNVMDTIGGKSIGLSDLNWSGANFYYKIEFTSDGTDTPVLDEISVGTDYPSSGNLISSIKDTGQPNPSFTTITWNETLPANTDIDFKVRSSDNADMSGATDWSSISAIEESGGDISGIGQGRYVQYQALLTTSDPTVTPQLHDVTINWGITSSLTSSPYNTGDPGNVLAKIEWSETLLADTDIQFQVRTGIDSTAILSNAWMGPDGTSGTYFTDPTGGEAIPAALKDGTGDQWIQYKVFLSSTGANTPTLSDVTMTYVVNAPPEFNSSSPASANQESTGEVKINYSIRDSDTSQGTVQPNYVTPSFEYSLDGGTSWSAIDCSYMASGDCDNKYVEETDFTDYTATWDAKSQIGQEYSSNAKIRITIDDKEAANNTAQTSTSAFELDTKDPQNPQVVVDASTQYGTNDATLYPSVSDDTIEAGVRGSMIISTTSTFSGASWQDYATSTTFNLPADPSTVYVKFKDAYGNVSAVASVTTPPTPDGVYCQDVSNTDEEVYRLFVGWNVVDLPAQGDFDRYIILKSTSTDPASFEQVVEITDRNQNYWMDSDVEYGTTYYYQLLSKDTLEDVSFRSEMVNGTPGSGGEDTLPPSFASGPTASEIYTTQVTISWETDELSRAILHYGLSPGDYTMSKSVNTYATSHSVVLAGLNTNTTYYLMVEAIDTSDNSATSSEISFTTQDGPVISNVVVSQVFNEKATFFWLTDISADSYVYYSTSTEGTFLSTGKTESVTQHEITIENLTPGTRYYFYVKSSNALDNNEGEYYTFVTTNDTKPPEISNLSAWTTAYTAVIVWQTDELSDSKIEWGTSSESYSFSTTSDVYTISHAVKLTNLIENQTYYYRVTSKDVNGNQTQSVERTFVPIREKDTTPPVISDVATSSVYTTQAEISWTTDELADSQVEYSTDPDFSTYEVKTNSSMVTSHSLVLTDLTPDTSYYFRVKSKDIEDNQSTKEDNFSFTTLSGPIISDVVVSQVFNGQASIEWQTDIPAASTVVYSSNPDFSAYFVSSDTDSVSVHQITLTDLSIGTIYYFYVESGNATDDNGGNYYYFSTANDINSPQISNISSFAKENSGLILWETDELSNSKVIYGTTTSCGNETSLDDTLTKKHAVSISGLSANTTYYYKVVSCDANSNCATSTLNSFTTLLLEEPKEGDAEGPQISEVKATVVSDTSVVITWKTDELADSKVDYGKSTSYTETVSSSDLTIEHIINLSNLESSTTYHFQVVSADSSGNSSTSTDFTFTTQTPDDVTPPNIANVTVSSINLTSAVITWATTDENSNSIVDYGETVLLGQMAGNFDDSTTSHSVALTNLTASTTYYFQVRSQDSAGNTATDNNSGNYYSFTTLKDTTSPVISDVSVSTISDTKATIVWETNELSTSQVVYGTTDSYGSQTEEDSTLTYQHSVTLTELTKKTTYHFKVVSKDSAGNSTSSTDNTFTTTDEPGIVKYVGGGGGVVFIEKKVKLDTTPPVISDIEIEKVDYASAVISWKTNEKTDSFIEYGMTTDYEKGVFGKYESATSHSLTLADLTSETTYHFKVLGKDDYGNLGFSSDKTFTTLGEIAEVSEKAIPEKAISEKEKGLVKKAVDILTKLSNPRSLASVSKALEESAKRVLSPPLIAGEYPRVEVGPDWAQITWLTDKKSNSLVAYAEENKYHSERKEPYTIIAGNPDELVTFHEVLIENLKPNTFYHFQVRSKPLIGPIAKSGNRTFLTTSLKLEISDISVKTKKENEAEMLFKTSLPAKAKIKYRDVKTNIEKEIEDDSFLRDHKVSLPELSANTEYSLEIIAQDEKGEKVSSPKISFSTGKDKRSPKIFNVKTASAISPGGTFIQTIINWQTDEFSSARVYYVEGIKWQENLVKTTPLNKDLTLRHIVVLPKLKPGKVYLFRVESIDSSENVAFSKNYSLYTPQKRKTIIQIMIRQFEKTFGWLKNLRF